MLENYIKLSKGSKHLEIASIKTMLKHICLKKKKNKTANYLEFKRLITVCSVSSILYRYSAVIRYFKTTFKDSAVM